MASTYKTPGVYVEEISLFPPSVAQVETAIPAFIGYTEKAVNASGTSLTNVPTEITSMKEYESYFGYPHDDTITVAVSGTVSTGYSVAVTEPTPNYMMYYAVKMFYDNGGGKCYITSIGAYKSGSPYHTVGDYTSSTGTVGLQKIALEDEPTLLVVPDAIKLTSTDYSTLVQAMLSQCGSLGDRFCIFDLYNGGVTQSDSELLTNRGYFGSNNLKYGAAYYPYLKSAINYYVNTGETNVTLGSAYAEDLNADSDTTDSGESFSSGATLASIKSTNTAVYNAIKAELQNHYLTLPPAGAVAGVYAAIDSSRGVWKAPANVSLTDVIAPILKVDDAKQASLNVDATSGKSINAIRSFAGKGTLIWGARTLSGNDNEWRYISVRRFFNMVEESVKKATFQFVFEPNDANTWVKVKGMIENFLTLLWRDGALAGAKPEHAFFVKVGLGVTMTSQDILEGKMNVEIGMAAVRPAEFIILKFSHKMQES